MSSSEIYTCRWKFSEFNLQNYYCNKFRLPIQDLHRINWAALRLARNGLTPSQQTFCVKHSIGWSATGNRLKLQGNIISTCPICNDDEDTDHLWQCSARKMKIKTLFSTFQEHLHEIDTDPLNFQALSAGFHNWLFPDEDLLPIPDSLQATFKHQSIIGWHLATRGFLSNDWAIQQDRYAAINNNIIIGDVWCAKICKWWIKSTHEIWLERNASVHDATDDSLNRQAEETRAQVTLLYGKETDLSAQDRIIFHMPLPQRLQQPIHLLTIWLNNTAPIVDNCIQVFRTRLLRGHRNIRTYFPPNQQTVADTIIPSTDIENSPLPSNISISSATDVTRTAIQKHPNLFQVIPDHQVGNPLLPVRFATPRVGDQHRTALG
jgi:hypothetical protein